MVETVQAFARGLSVITSFDTDTPRQTLSQVAVTTGLPRATARRLLNTLIELGYADTNGTTFWLTPRIVDLGYSYVSSLQLPEIALPHMEKLSAELDESSSLSVLDGTDVVYIERVPTRRIMSIRINIGSRFPAYATSMGRVLLAGLDEASLNTYFEQALLIALTDRTVHTEPELRGLLATVRKEGHAIVDQELEAGLRSAAAPITNADGNVIAAINVSTHSGSVALSALEQRIVPALKDTALAISRDYNTRKAY